MLFDSDSALEFGNALLDAVEIAKETGKTCYITKINGLFVAVDHIEDSHMACAVNPPDDQPDNARKAA